jgi:hypothetical protein
MLNENVSRTVGEEWTNDWYASDWYAKSPVKDPQGPRTGTSKVVRGWSINHGELKPGETVLRGHQELTLASSGPVPAFMKLDKFPSHMGPTVRCVVD